MSPKIKNILIILVAGVLLFAFVYFFFIKKGTTETPLTSSSEIPATGNSNPSDVSNETSEVSRDFISVLLSVKNIKLDDTIFKDEAFLSLRDSSIVLVQDGNEGRPNPFAPIGSELNPTPTTPAISTTPTTPATPPTSTTPTTPATPATPVIH